MSITTQSPASIAGTSELTTARTLTPLFYAKSVPSPDGRETPATRYTPEQTLDHIAGRLLDGVGNARTQLDDAENLIEHGAAYSTGVQLVAAHEAHADAIATLKRLLPWYRALLCGAPMAWFIAHKSELESMLQAQRERDGGHRFADVTTQSLLDALTKI